MKYLFHFALALFAVSLYQRSRRPAHVPTDPPPELLIEFQVLSAAITELADTIDGARVPDRPCKFSRN